MLHTASCGSKRKCWCDVIAVLTVKAGIAAITINCNPHQLNPPYHRNHNQSLTRATDKVSAGDMGTRSSLWLRKLSPRT